MPKTIIELDGETAAEISKQLRDAADKVENLKISSGSGKIDLAKLSKDTPLWKVTYDTSN